MTSLTSRTLCAFPVLLVIGACSGADDPQMPGGGAGVGGSGAVAGVGGGALTGGASGVGGVGVGGMTTGGAGVGGGVSGGAPATGGGATGGAGTGGGETGGAPGSGGSNGSCDATGFYVEGGKVYDANCNEFVMRGANVAHAWYAGNTQQTLSDLAAVGANAVRVVLSNGTHGEGWNRTDGATVSQIISWCKENNLVALLEVHDSTGYDESEGASHPDAAVTYWTSQEIVNALSGEERYVMINIANEPLGNTTTSIWSSFHQSAVADLRAAGLNHLLVVDAPNWGQDHEATMRDNTNNAASDILAADPNQNVLFSVHMYQVYAEAGTIRTYFDNFLAHGLSLMVGEFAADHGSSGDVDEATIMAEAETRGLGYFGWSWSGNSGGLESLDMTISFNPDNLTTWGDTVLYGQNGIANTSEICTCFTQ